VKDGFADSERRNRDRWLTPSRRYLSAPQSNSTNSVERPVAAVTALKTLSASRVTSLPMPSPGITAIRAEGPPFRKGMPGKFLPPRRLDFLPSDTLCGMKRPSILRLRCRRNAILPSKRTSRHLLKAHIHDKAFLRALAGIRPIGPEKVIFRSF